MRTTTSPFRRDTITGAHYCNTWFPAPGINRRQRWECSHGFTHAAALARKGHTLTTAGERRC